MSVKFRLVQLFILLTFSGVAGIPVVHADDDSSSDSSAKAVSLNIVKKKHWDEIHVRRVLKAFAYGGHSSDGQIELWASMKPRRAIVEMLTFEVNNERLSPSEDMSAGACGSLEELQNFWSSNDPDNSMTWQDRYRYATLSVNQSVSKTNLQRTWIKAISTRGCNPFLHKMALFLTNYHASIHINSSRTALMRSYYDDYLAALSSGKDFIDVMTTGASHAAVARAYGHKDNRVRRGVFYGNEDFAREYLQLFFGIPGTSEDEEYYETVSIKNNALLLTGMNLDQRPNAYGSVKTGDWQVAPIVFTDHTDDRGRRIWNESYHYENDLGNGSCLEILHANICGPTADVKLKELGPVAANHPESMQNVPVNLVQFFADDNLNDAKIAQIRVSWKNSRFSLLAFVQRYAISTAFHHESTVKFLTAFDRNLIVQNASTLDNEENFAKPKYYSPYDRMSRQGVKVFEPVRNVFGHQTGLDAVNDPYIYKDAFQQNAFNSYYHVGSQGPYKLAEDGEWIDWKKDWGSVIPLNGDGDHVVSDIANWLWNHFIGDGGKNFDIIARAQVQSLLATGRDFGYEVDRYNRDPDVFYSSEDIEGAHAGATQTFADHAVIQLDFSQRTHNERVGNGGEFHLHDSLRIRHGGQVR